MHGHREFLIKVSANNFIILGSVETRAVSLQFNETAGVKRGWDERAQRLTEKFSPLCSTHGKPPLCAPDPSTLVRPPVHYIIHAHKSIHSRHERNNNKVTFTICRTAERGRKKTGGLMLLVASWKRGENSDELSDALFATRVHRG